jgi:hypothetical protein
MLKKSPARWLAGSGSGTPDGVQAGRHIKSIWLHIRNRQGKKNIDGVVKSSIYCVAAIFQTLGILHVLPRP